MGPKLANQLIDHYLQVLRLHPILQQNDGYREQLKTAHNLVEKLNAWSPEERGQKWDTAQRWIGFIQGVLYSSGVFTSEQIDGHSQGKFELL